MVESRLLIDSISFGDAAMEWAVENGIIDTDGNLIIPFPTIIGVPDGSPDLGTFDIGIIPGNRTIKQAMQALETGISLRMVASTNLSDLPNKAVARTNLGLGSAATWSVGTSGAVIPLLNTANTWTGKQSFTAGTSTTQMVEITAPVGQQAVMMLMSGASARWAVLRGGESETGSNVGSDFYISRYNDAGAWINNPIQIVRSTGVVNLGQPLPVTSGGTGLTSLTALKSTLALDNVNNTTDANKPISTATQNALNGKLNITGGTVTGGLVVTGKAGNRGINTAQDYAGEIEVLGNGTGASMITFHRPGAFATYLGIDIDNVLKIGGWSHGAAAYKIYHEGAKPTKAEIGLGSVDNTSDAAKPISTATQNALNLKANVTSPSFTGDGTITRGLTVNSSNTSGLGIVLSDDGDIVDLNDGFCAMRFSSGVRIHTGNRAGTPVITLASSGRVTASEVFATSNIWTRNGQLVWDQGNLTNLSQLSNGPGYINANGRSYPRRVGGGDLNFNWSGQGGQPTWLWGGSDGVNMYVYNPSNFNVNYADNSGAVGGVGLAGAMGGGLARFTGVNNSGTGYVCFNDGFKIAWGQTTVVKDTLHTITMPVTFVSYYRPVITLNYVSVSDDFGENTWIYDLANMSQFRVMNAANVNNNITWIVVGY